MFEIAFEDEIYWIARCQLALNDEFTAGSEDSRRALMKSEFDTMRYVKLHTTIPLPDVYDYNTSSDNSVGCPYIMMEALDGSTLPSGGFRKSVPKKHQEKVLSTIAEHLIQLSTLRFPAIGRLDLGLDGVYSIKPCLDPAGCQWSVECGPYRTSIEYFWTTRKLDYDMTLKQLPKDHDQCFAAWIRLQTATSLVQLEFNHGPFPLHHIDLRLANILFDKDYNVTGIIDWSYAMTVPLETFANLQSDFGAPDTRDEFIEHLRIHESHIDPNTPFSNFLSTNNPAPMAIIPLQGFTPEKQHRMIVARIMLKQLFGKDAKWGTMKRFWRKSQLYPNPMGPGLNYVWLTAGVILVLLIASYIMLPHNR